MPHSDPEKRKEYTRNYRIRNLEKSLKYERNWRDKNRESVRKKNREWKARNREKVLEEGKIYYRKNVDKIAERTKEYMKKNYTLKLERDKKYAKENPEKIAKTRRNSHLKIKFGITIDDYNSMLSSQNGKCAICGGDNKRKSFAVDHDHKTGRVRELLCDSCNVGIGRMRDDPDILEKAAIYLRKHRND